MSKEKPKSAMAALLERAQTASQNFGADVGVASREMPTSQPIEKSLFHSSPTDQQNATTIIEVNPQECCLWQYSDRPEEELGDLESLAQSMKEHGQQEPVLIRPSQQTAHIKYEIIFGHRRWRAAKLAGISLKAILQPLTDQQAAICQKEENENRKDLSDYARALAYRAQIDGGVFKNEIELSKSLNISKNTLNDIMAFIRIPQFVRDAIPNFRHLSRITAIKLAGLCKDPRHHDLLCKLGPRIGDKTITAANIERFLATSKLLSNPNLKVDDTITLKDQNNHVLIHLKPLANGGLNIKVAKKLARNLDLDKIKGELLALFNRSNNTVDPS